LDNIVQINLPPFFEENWIKFTGRSALMWVELMRVELMRVLRVQLQLTDSAA
jgi:hypothetical protein